ncbi:MAG: caspase family protein [Treponema sp.]|nr:caspase family protein [Treponema sp.]
MRIKTLILLAFCFLIFSCKQENTGNELKVYPQLGHSDIINTVIFTPDDRYIVSGGWDMTVKLWDVSTGREKETFLGHTGMIEALAASDRFIASSAQDGVRVWDIRTGKETARLNVNAAALSFSRDEKFLYTASLDGIKVWDIKKRKVIKTISNDSTYIASFTEKEIAYYSFEIFIVNKDKGLKSRDINKIPENDLISSLFLSKDDTKLASGQWDGSVLFCDLQGRGYERFQVHSRKVNAVAICGTNRFLASASDDNTIALMDFQNGNSYKKLLGHTDSVRSVAFSSDSKIMVSASSDKTIKIWDTASAQEIRTIAAYSDIPEFSVFSADMQYIAAFTNNNYLRLWNAKTGILIDYFKINERISSISFSDDNENIITSSPDGIVRRFWIKTGREIESIADNEQKPALTQSFCINGRFLTSAYLDGDIIIWDYNNGQNTIFNLNDPTLVTAVVSSPDMRYIAAGFSSGKVSITEINTGKTVVLARHKDSIETIQFNKNGDRLAYGAKDGEIHVLDIKTGKRILPVMRHQFRVTSVSFSADGKKLISGAFDNTAVIWNAQTGEKIASLVTFHDDEWITVTNDGYYVSSTRGDELLNVRIGITFNIYGMDQFSALFSQEDIVRARLSDLPEDPNLVSILSTSRMRLVPPSVTITAPSRSSTGREEIKVAVKDHFNQLDRIQVVINGRLLGEEELNLFNSNFNMSAENTSLIVKDSLDELIFSLPVNLETGPNRIQVIAKNNYAVSEGRSSVFVYNYSDTKDPPADLWLLAVGTNNYLYGNPDNNLKHSINSANGIKSALENQQGKRYRNVYAKSILDSTKENILKNINEFYTGASPNDVLVLFLSGHGMDNEGKYYYLPADVTFTGTEPDYSRAISFDDIGVLLDFPGRKIIFIDSCYSGGLDSARFIKSLRNQSTAIFTSSQDNQLSWEGIGYGIFTDALIRGFTSPGEITLSALGRYVFSRVEQLTMFAREIQHPYIYIPEGLYGFIFAD